ncbi:helix-turn-helix transcriptional regulator [Brytella acorum]|uniref:Helix-turn-helix transcriptional regulator n=1 Tax=Brytella acorum TaxID=2959299 RepID=A0AA35XWG3_9PROT|nr:helix-turn-helix transcriptional regulator [Brytella acorum]MDF3625979.1 helix-turn-helix transcriptional regulator [Brytella acorum]CAI9119202.1 helix-turn-helix transcriptional regulator [Brytella acorum]
MSSLHASEKALGLYLRNARQKLDPAALGFPATRRRTPGLRREEVAQRAELSVTWYTWLEQGRGGMPSAAALERLAGALMLTDAEREHLFLLGLGRSPEARYRQDTDVTPRLQRVLDRLDPSPAFIRTATWDMVAWNRAATELMTDFALLPPEHRNILRLIFLDPRSRTLHPDWESTARFIVSSFRMDTARAGAAEAVEPLVAELCAASFEFRALWQDRTVHTFGHGAKTFHHPVHGPQAFEVSTFAVDGRPDLILVIYGEVS